MNTFRYFNLTLILSTLFAFQTERAAIYDLQLELVAENLVSPIALESPKDGTDRKFVVEQRGLVYIIDAKGKLLNTGIYTYTLTYKLVDVGATKKTGNITLIR